MKSRWAPDSGCVTTSATWSSVPTSESASTPPTPIPTRRGITTSPVSRTGSGSTWRSAIRSKVRAGHPYEYEQAGWYYQPACSISVFPSKANGFPAAWTPNQKTNFSSFISPSWCRRGTRVVKCDACSWRGQRLGVAPRLADHQHVIARSAFEQVIGHAAFVLERSRHQFPGRIYHFLAVGIRRTDKNIQSYHFVLFN